jgi:BirA family transcriptional regulator, biotin operon repressor / biotin---[acetyl-CoA-carboxylase] ligase
LSLASETRTIGNSFFELQSVDSTNNYALARIHEGLACHGECFFAHRQTKGKGQRGKSWITEDSSNILLSIILQPRFLGVFQQFQLSASIAVATLRFLSKYAGNEVSVKWPNDIFWRDRKAGGILIENIVGSNQSAVSSGQSAEGSEQPAVGSWLWAVAGIGLNVNQVHFPGELHNAVSLKQTTGKTFDLIPLTKELCASVDLVYDQLRDHQFEKILDEYNNHLYKNGERVKLKKNNIIFEATIRSVDHSGRLQVQHAFEESFEFGEAEWLL